jgi:hypothetical protein
MNKKIEETRKSNSIELFGAILPFLPTLLLKSGWAFLRFKMEAKRGGDIFQKELINQGLDKTTAARITEIYLEGSHVFQSLVKMH